MFHKRLLVLAPLIALVAVMVGSTTTLAHERRTIANGKYDVVVGWDAEPTYLGLKNAASIRISEGGSNPPKAVEGADKTLKLQIRQGGSTKEFPLRAAFGQPGYYIVDMIPTRVGDYLFTFTGTINQDSVNERFDSADGKFDSVKPANDIAYPVALENAADVAAMAQAAQTEVQTTRTLAYIGIGLGILGVLSGLAAWATRPRGAAVSNLTRPAGGPSRG